MRRPLTLIRRFVLNTFQFLLMLMADRRELFLPRLIAIASIIGFFAYTRSPYQLIPENVPLFGYADDFSILALGFLVARRVTPLPFDAGGSMRRRGGQGLALRADYAPAFGGFGRGTTEGFTDAEPQPAWTLYDMLGYRHAWRIRSLGSGTPASVCAPIVIGGCGRSGTTLLRTIFNRHPSVFCGDESTVFLRRVSSPRDIARRYGFDANAIVGMFRTTRSQVEFIERFQAECLKHSGKAIWAEKTPDNVLRFDFIRRRFPRARIIHVIRDGRDVVCSLRRQKWFKVPEHERNDIGAVEYAVDYWMRRVVAGRKFRNDPRYFEVRYEDLVNEPTETLGSLFRSMGLEWVDSVMLPSTPAPLRQVHEGSINTDALGQWRRELTDAEIALIERKAGGLLRELGYTP